MPIKEITIGRGKKLSQSYNSIDYHVSVTYTLEELEPEELVIKGMRKQLAELIKDEEFRLQGFITGVQLQEEEKYNNTLTKAEKSVKVVGSVSSSGKDAVNPESLTDSKAVPKKGKGKYDWKPVEGGGKVRKCNNVPCPYWLKYSEDLGTYQHGKYDPNTKIWAYVDDICEFYTGGS